MSAFANKREGIELGRLLGSRAAPLPRGPGARSFAGQLKRALENMESSRRHLPASIFGQAISYTLSNWESLIKCVGNGRVEPECSAESQPKVAQRASEARQIDNNGVENAIRPTAIGKKNWLFFEDADAGQRSAIIYTIIESCRRRGIDPHAYLRDVLTRITESTNWNVADLTPQKWAKTEKGGVGAVSVVAFTYEIYTIPSQNNGVLGATLTLILKILQIDSLRSPFGLP